VDTSGMQRLRRLDPATRKRLVIAAQLVGLVVIGTFVGYAVRDSWSDAEQRLWLAVAIGGIATYYMVFVVGWTIILDRLGIPLPYTAAVRAEMLSMLAKYVPGGVWTPAARVLAARRAGVDDTSRVLGSIAFEAGLSAIAGVLVLFAGVLAVGSADVPYVPLVLFLVVVAVLLHPRVFAPAASFLLRKVGGGDVPPLRERTILALLAFYSGTWLLGGAALWAMAAALGDRPPVSSIPYLGGASAVGAIVAVLVVFAPSGLGVREGSMYGLLLAVMPSGIALAVVVLNRLVITGVEVVLFVAANALLRERPADDDRGPDRPELARTPT
jgi:glycosyltransferase 2 family protein